MPITNQPTPNSGQFSSWHMERAGDNRYSDSDQGQKPEAGARERTLVTDGRPSGTHYRDNPWHDGGAGDRGPRAHELARYNGSSYEKQSPGDAPFMKGDRSRTADGTLREVRADELVKNNPTLEQRAPELVARYGDKTVGDLRALFGGKSVSQIGDMTKAERQDAIKSSQPPVEDGFDQTGQSGQTGFFGQTPSFGQVGQVGQTPAQGSVTSQVAQLRAGF